MNKSGDEMMDAIGKPLSLEREYVTSQNHNGIQTTKFGKLVSLETNESGIRIQKRVTLLVTKIRHGVWGNFDREEVLETPKKTLVYAINLVPIS